MFMVNLILIIRKLLSSPTSWARYIGVTIGEDNLIGKNHWSSEPYLITVGNHCQLTNCQIFTHGGGQVVRNNDPTFDTFGRVVIGDYVYLGANSLIMPGVTIGNNVLVAAGSVVTKSIPSGVVVAGNPAKFVCYVKDYYERNKMYNAATKGLQKEKKKKRLLSQGDEKFINKSTIVIPPLDIK